MSLYSLTTGSDLYKRDGFQFTFSVETIQKSRISSHVCQTSTYKRINRRCTVLHTARLMIKFTKSLSGGSDSSLGDCRAYSAQSLPFAYGWHESTCCSKSDMLGMVFRQKGQVSASCIGLGWLTPCTRRMWRHRWSFRLMIMLQIWQVKRSL